MRRIITFGVFMTMHCFAPGVCFWFSRRRSVHTLLSQHTDAVPQQPLLCQNHPGQLQVPHRGRTSVPPLARQVCVSCYSFESGIILGYLCSNTFFVRLLSREIELPFHDNGMEPVEFLKSMGISLTSLNEAMAADTRSLRVI